MRKLKVDWTELNNTGQNIEDYILEFEKNRLLFEKEINNVEKYWTGNDSIVYQSQAVEYLEGLKKDVDYLYEWASYFKRSSRIYNGVEEDSLQKIRSSIDSLSSEILSGGVE